MSGFLYWAPVSVTPTLELLRSWGLGYAFSESPDAREARSAATPTGGNGYIFADSKRQAGRAVKIIPGQQTWRKIPGREGQQELWLGWWNDAPPTPAELARPRQLSGAAITMADGREWLLPIVRSFDAETGEAQSALPCAYDLDDAGKLIRGPIQAAHRWLWDLTEPYWLAMVNDDDVSDQDCLDCAAKLLGANYVVDAIELAALGVFSPQISPVGIVATAVDYFTWHAWLESKKKTESESTPVGSSSSSGATDAPQDTAPPARTY